LGLAMPEDGQRKPLVVCITRLVPQKGIHLIRHAIFRTQEQGGQFILLGSGHADADFRALAENEVRHVYSQLTHSLFFSHETLEDQEELERSGRLMEK